MNILVIGSSGMLGHTMLAILSKTNGIATFGTERAKNDRLRSFLRSRGVTGSQIIWWEADPLSLKDSVKNLFDYNKWDCVINCIGVVKQDMRSYEDFERAVVLNALFPRTLEMIAGINNCRVIHVSTDCVFSGRIGRYSEMDPPDPVDDYGQTKLLGEVAEPNLAIRSSFIGMEFGERKKGLLEWFLAQKGCVPGFQNAYWSGVTTLELSRVVSKLIRRTDVEGVLHIGGREISKYDLLLSIQREYKRDDITVLQKRTPVSVNRTLLTRRAVGLGITIAALDEQLAELRRFYECC